MQTYIDPFFFTNVNFRWNDTVFKYLLIIVNIVFVESIISLSTSVNNALETLGEVSKYGVFSGPYFPVFRKVTEKTHKWLSDYTAAVNCINWRIYTFPDLQCSGVIKNSKYHFENNFSPIV